MGTRTKVARKCGEGHILEGREPTQMGWYEFASSLVSEGTVLDVGCGSGEGLKVLCKKAKQAIGIDLDERLKRDDVEIHIRDVSEIADKSFDAVVCIDVIEHIEDAEDFVKQLVRIARKTMFISTPNYAVSKNVHPYHVREYTPREFECMFSHCGNMRIYGGNCTGDVREEIGNKDMYYFLNDLYRFKGTSFFGKVLKRILFTKIWAHQAAVITLGKDSGMVS